MGRAKTIDETQLFQATEKIILRDGYAGFHFKALAEELGVARSTIYNYFSKKEELVTAFMVHLLKQVVHHMDNVSENEEPVRGLVDIWSKYANIHQMMHVMPYIDREATPLVQSNVQEMFGLLGSMRSRISTILTKEQERGRVRKDIQVETMTGLVMAVVQIPIQSDQEARWVEEVYKLLKDGLYD
ncbi:TetR/AcrR family transcriptional regulator [Alkalicoccus chagannorensis]|uniref:TetR/AcrR family transcriptional regulator n=1 Tax=Alkalicoccus chagannorensis TaxID=427072 RepID=UPI000410B478|nr:TetR/AcrR family transcriptional regulator [Alkalicoccus chagannorensis]